MDIEFGRDIVTLKNVIRIKATDEEVECLIKDAGNILAELTQREEFRQELLESPTIQLLQALGRCDYNSGVCACNMGPTCQARLNQL